MDNRGITKPRQNLPESKKDDEWYLDNIYYYLSLYNDPANQAQRSLIERNWRVYLGDIDQSQINYLIYPEGNTDPTLTVQAIFKNYQLAFPLIQQRIGEFLRQKLNFSVDIVNREAVLKKEERKASIMAEKIAKKALAQIEQETGIAIPVEDISLGLPDDIKKLQGIKIREGVEDLVLNGLHYISDTYELQEIFRKGLESMLVANCILMQNRRINNDPVAENVHPLDCSVFMKTDDDNVRWGNAWITARWMGINEVMDAYELTNEQVDELEKLQSLSFEQMTQTYWQYGASYSGFGINYFYRNIGQESAKVLVTEVQWRSLNHVYIKKSKNEYADDYYYKKITEEEYAKFDKEKKSGLKKVPFYDLREATLCGFKMLLKKGRVKGQTRKQEYGIGRVPLDLCGIKKDPTQAIMTILAPLQIEYSIGWWHIERLLAQSGGKAIELWLHQKPSGWTNEKWIFYAKHKGIIPREYKDGDELMPNPNMQQAVDLGMSSSFQYLIAYVQLIETTAMRLIGTNPAAQGFLKGDELVGNIQANVINASTVTEGIFYDTRRAIEQILNDAADKLRKWWKEAPPKVWLTDGEWIPLKATADLPLYEYGVTVKNDSTDQVRMQKFEALAQMALSSGGADMLDYIIQITDAENSAEAKKIIVQGMEEIRKKQDQIKQQELQIQEASVQVGQQANALKEQELQIKGQVPVQVQKMGDDTKIQIKKMDLEFQENDAEISANDEKNNIVLKAITGKSK